MPTGNIMRVPAIPAPGAGYAQPGNRGFTAWRAMAYGGALGSGPTDPAALAELARGMSWQTTTGTPRTAADRPSRPQFMSTVPVPTSGGAPVAPVPVEQAPVAPVADGNGGTSVMGTGASCAPCMLFRLGALLVVAYGIYKVVT